MRRSCRTIVHFVGLAPHSSAILIAVNSRTIALLLLFASTTLAGPPTHPDPPAGRQAFNQCMVHAETAWKNGRTNEALRWYHTAKNIARAHNLTLSERDEALTAYVARHEAGLTGPQPRNMPGCDTDADNRITPKPRPKTARQLPPIDKARSFPTRTIPVPETRNSTNSETSQRSIPENRTASSLPLTPATKKPLAAKRPATTTSKLLPATKNQARKDAATTKNADRDLVPPVTSRKTKPDPPVNDSLVKGIPEADPPAKDIPEADPPAKDTPEADSPTKDIPAADPPTKDAPAEDPPAKDIPAAGSPTKDAPAEDIPAASPPSKNAPSADSPAKDPQETDASTPDVPAVTPRPTTPPPVAKTSATTEKDNDNRPVTLTIDQSSVPLKVIPDNHESEMAARPVSPAPLTEADADSLPASESSAADHQLTLLMFGPIVVALFILGLLTQEMPGPKRILAWAIRRNRDKNSETVATAPITKAPQEIISAPSDLLPVTLGTRRRNKTQFYTATIELPGLEPTRLVKRRDGSPLFRSRAAATSSARALARRLGYDGITEPARRQKAA